MAVSAVVGPGGTPAIPGCQTTCKPRAATASCSPRQSSGTIRSRTMKTRLTLVLAALALSLGGLVLVRNARTDDPAPPDKEAPPKVAASRITHVTVYPNNALLTREVEVPAGTGTLELVVNSLPERTIDNSLYSEGGDGIRVLSTRFRTRPIKENTREEVRKLEDE